ncbi:hypothetical protein JTE90_026047 [Oedothorax gibbosus]|uniref:Uncharacterized protein n=1 Tax=Oedothorax gibbosus TaxID=931172 RepID=A0AAV6UBH5_9ARAC|nr:hypothetical protein JTE90_026047 [Oedothorax gibbosus]
MGYSEIHRQNWSSLEVHREGSVTYLCCPQDRWAFEDGHQKRGGGGGGRRDMSLVSIYTSATQRCGHQNHTISFHPKYGHTPTEDHRIAAFDCPE